MKLLRKILPCVIVTVLALSLCACGSADSLLTPFIEDMSSYAGSGDEFMNKVGVNYTVTESGSNVIYSYTCSEFMGVTFDDFNEASSGTALNGVEAYFYKPDQKDVAYYGVKVNMPVNTGEDSSRQEYESAMAEAYDELNSKCISKFVEKITAKYGEPDTANAESYYYQWDLDGGRQIAVQGYSQGFHITCDFTIAIPE